MTSYFCTPMLQHEFTAFHLLFLVYTLTFRFLLCVEGEKLVKQATTRYERESERLVLPNQAGYTPLTHLPDELLLSGNVRIAGDPIYPKDLMEEKAFDAFQTIRDAVDGDSIGQHEEKKQEESLTKTKIFQIIQDALSYLQADDWKATLTLIGYKGGDPKAQINQDRAVIISPFYYNSNTIETDKIKSQLPLLGDLHQHDFFMGVFDGHGPNGEIVSQYAATNLPKLLAYRLHQLAANASSKSNKEPSDSNVAEIITNLITETFIDIDALSPSAAAYAGGCTASIVLRYGATLFIANAGDSRSFVATTTVGTSTSPQPQSQQHKSAVIKNTTSSTIHYITREDKPHLLDERTRIESLGGRVSIPSKGGTSRVHYGNYGLAMSRSLGDWNAGVIGVIPDPIVHVIHTQDLRDSVLQHQQQQNDDQQCISEDVSTCNYSDADTEIVLFVVSGTDGLFDYVEPQLIADTIGSTFSKSSSKSTINNDDDGSLALHLIDACGDLVLTSANGWNVESRGRYRDDIALAVHKVFI